MNRQTAPAETHSRSVFFTIVTALLIVLALEIALLTGMLLLSHVTQQLDQNAQDILNKQLDNRQSYLENFLLGAQNMTTLSEEINQTTEELLASGEISLDTLGKSSNSSAPLLRAVSGDLLTHLRSKSVTGVFLVLNTTDLDTCEDGTRLPGIYLRDLDPDAANSLDNSDLSLEFAPASVAEDLHISMDSCWRPSLIYSKESSAFVYEPFQAALHDDRNLDSADYGRWTARPFTLPGDDRSVIAYSQPLRLSDGTVYGVIGVELLSSYVESKLPYTELQNGGKGSYLLATSLGSESGTLVMEDVVYSGEDSLLQSRSDSLLCQNVDRSGSGWIHLDDANYYVCTRSLTLYSRNAPFSGEHWLLAGAVDRQELFAFSGHVRNLLVLTVLLTLSLGLICSFLVSRRLATPIAHLSAEVAAANPDGTTIPQLSRTGIRELDQFAAAITALSQGILDTSTRFLRILDMASTDLAGYEITPASDKIFVTDNFFSMLGLSDVDGKTLTPRQFDEIMQAFTRRTESIALAEGGSVFVLPQPDGSTHYLRLRVANDHDLLAGVLEDVTLSMTERLRVEHERDYDMLTGLYNRRAFQVRCHALFQMPEVLHYAAFVMMDLDNLKRINDTFGHDLGDRYIQLAGHSLHESLPEKSLCSRLSGDEFLILLYGFDTPEERSSCLTGLHATIQSYSAPLPNGGTMRISISAGVARYPEDAGDPELLRKYADFAMYQVKHSHKGDMSLFQPDAFAQAAHADLLRREFMQLLQEGRVVYHFQPLFSVTDGHAAAYEALMRTTMPNLRSPADVMKLAQKTGMLYEVEHLTFFRASEAFVRLQEEGLIAPDAKLFINSISSVCLNDADHREFRRRFAALIPNLVVEITEEEELNPDVLECKRQQMHGDGAFALDDYGSGYSNSNSLLELSPQYIKVDIAIIRDIDSDGDKQQVLRDIAAYAHQRGMQIVAEGIETPAELECVRALGADLLQGYLLARPNVIPAELSEEARAILQRTELPPDPPPHASNH